MTHPDRPAPDACARPTGRTVTFPSPDGGLPAREDIVNDWGMLFPDEGGTGRPWATPPGADAWLPV